MSTKLARVGCYEYMKFADACLDMEIDATKKEALQNTFQAGLRKYNKVSLVYGKSSSGKTALCRVIPMLQKLTYTPVAAIHTSTLINTLFPYDPICENVMSFSICVDIDGTQYRWWLQLNKRDEVCRESIYKCTQREVELLHRVTNSARRVKQKEEEFIITHSELRPDSQTVQNALHKGRTYLNVAADMGNALAVKLRDAINSIRVVNLNNVNLDKTDLRILQDAEINRMFVKTFKQIEPALETLSLRSAKISNYEFRAADADDFENNNGLTSHSPIHVMATYCSPEFGCMNGAKDFFKSASSSTIRLFMLLVHVYNTLKSGGVLIVDDIDSGIDGYLVKEVIKLFCDSESNPNNAQLICTLRNPLLIEGPYRRDAIWCIVNSSPNNSSCLMRLNILPKPRNDYKTKDIVRKLTDAIENDQVLKYFSIQ